MNQPSTSTVRELARTRTVLYINSEIGGSLVNLGRVRESSLGVDRLARVALGTTKPRRVQEGLWVASLRGAAAYTPLSFPEPTRRYKLRVLTRVIREWLYLRGAEAGLLLFYWPEFPELAQRVPVAASAYDCTDDFGSMPGRLVPPGHVARLERRLLNVVDRAWVVSAGLLEGRAEICRECAVLPTAIDLRVFEDVARRPVRPLPALRDRGGPVIGYAGSLDARLDWGLLDAIAERRPEWTLLLVGYNTGAMPSSLAARPNVASTGALPYDLALQAISRFDVGIIPVRAGAFSHGNSFLKLADYLAADLPIVASEVPDTLGAAKREPEAVAVATGVDVWEAALDEAIARGQTMNASAARRRLLAERNNEHRTAVLLGGLEADQTARDDAALSPT